MKPDIHPRYVVTQVTCSCGNTFVTRSTAERGVIHVDTCNVCHPFYTGKQRVLDTAGRVAKFEQKYARAAAQKAAAQKSGPQKAGAQTAGAQKTQRAATSARAAAKKAAPAKKAAAKAAPAKKAAAKKTAAPTAPTEAAE